MILANVLTCYYKPKPGGFCRRYFRAINALLARGHSVHYLAVERFPIEHPSCSFHRFPWPSKHAEGFLFWGTFHLLAPFALLYLGIRHKISHGFAFGPTYGLFLQPLRWLKRIPVSLFLRADHIENHRINGRSDWLLNLEYWLECYAIAGTRMFGVSNDLTRRVLARHRYCHPAAYGTLPNNIDYRLRSSAHARASRTMIVIACVGVLETRKNQKLAIDVCAELDPTRFCLCLYGCGPAESELRKQVEKRRLGQRVRFMGWVDAEKIWSRVDLLLLPSLHEGAPNAALEALAQGIPILASDIAEHREILPPANLLPLDDHRVWQTHLNRIFRDPQRELERLREAQVRCVGALEFDWDTTICGHILQYPVGDLH